jgi:hypothetical protein
MNTLFQRNGDFRTSSAALRSGRIVECVAACAASVRPSLAARDGNLLAVPSRALWTEDLG